MSVRIIAEAGVNHNGDFETAKQLALKAKEIGADIVKYQVFIPELLVTETAKKAEYQEERTGKNESQLDMLSKLALSFQQFRDLKAYCKEIGIAFMATGFDAKSISFLHDIGCNLWKIASGEVTNLPLLRQIASYGGEVILSTGMCDLEEIRQSLEVFAGKAGVTLLHCTTAYPAPFEQINLRAMLTLRDAFRLPIGYSDHSQGIAVPIAAVAMGAQIIEKHFTLDKNMAGPDHKASLDPHEFSDMVAAIRQVEAALGTGLKSPTATERSNMQVARKSIVAARNISKGEIFTADNLTTKRPGTGISPMLWDQVMGRPANRDYTKDELICL